MTTITRKRGDTYADELTIKSTLTNQPVNIAGYTFLMTLDPSKAPVSNASNLYQLTGTIVDAALGKVEFAPSESQANQVGKWYYDVQMVDGAGRKRTVESGSYIYKQDITK